MPRSVPSPGFETHLPRGAPAGATDGPREAAPARVLDLTEAKAADPTVAGAKAANLAQAAAAGLPVLPGVVLSTGRAPDLATLRDAWERLSGPGHGPLVVRSSSTVEDAGESSMAGQFQSVLGVRTWHDFQVAVADVLRSSARLAPPGEPPAAMAVLVQPELAPTRGGVLFGIDPVSGDRRRLMVEAVRGSPHDLVSGKVTAARYVTSRRGRVLEGPDEPVLDARRRRRLARLARRAERVFGRPQDVEWAFDRGDRLWLLQSRPVTATGHRRAAGGPLLGPGPVGETFPHPLRPLELDLWVAPLRTGLGEALRVAGTVSRRRLRSSPVVTTVGGRVAADLDLLGAGPPRSTLGRLLDPRRPARQLHAAWRVGQVRAALPQVAAATIAEVDRHLAAVPRLASLSDGELVALVRRAPDELAPLHAREVLAGMLLPPADGPPPAAQLALAALAAGRAAGRTDADIVARTPVVLALTAPHVGRRHGLPDVPDGARTPGLVSDLAWREGLRLRARWVQEVAARAATELGRRLAVAGRLPDPDAVALLTLDELAGVARGAPAPARGELRRRAAGCEGPPLPAAFRLTADGEVVAVAVGGTPPGGRAAGGGRGVGPVRDDTPGERGGVLVVESLSPELAAELPGLSGLVSETGSTLSHLAILARELGVPTVVGVTDARRRFPPGATVVVDGGTGEVSLVATQERARS